MAGLSSQGRRAPTIADPRNRRGGQALASEKTTVNPPLYIDANGRLSIALAGYTPEAAGLRAGASNTSSLLNTTGGTVSGSIKSVASFSDADDNFATMHNQLNVQRTLNTDLMIAVADLTAQLNALRQSLKDGGLIRR